MFKAILFWLVKPLLNQAGQFTFVPGGRNPAGAAGFNPFARPGTRASTDLVNLETELADLLPRSPFVEGITDLERAGLDRIIAAADPAANLAAATRRFETATLPSLIARRSAAGFGRTDPAAAIARSFAPTAEAIELQSLANRITAGQSEINVGANLATRRANMMERALRILSQIQSLRTAQANVNARAVGRVNLGQSTPFRPSTGIPTVQNVVPFQENPLRAGRTDAQIQAQAQAREQAALADLSRFTGTPTAGGETFGPTLPRGVATQPGAILGGPGFGGTITIGGGPVAPRQIASVTPTNRFSNLRDPFARPAF